MTLLTSSATEQFPSFHQQEEAHHHLHNSDNHQRSPSLDSDATLAYHELTSEATPFHPSHQHGQRLSPSAVSWRHLPEKRQLLLLLASSFADFYQMASMHTFMIHQLRSFNPEGSAADLSHQAGLLLGSCSAATVVTAVLWGRAADHPALGRKTVILVGLLGSAVSSAGIGFAQQFTAVAAWALLGGAINGIAGASKTMAVESVGEEWQSRAALLQPASFFLANMIGPALSGLLADPIHSLPSIFGPGSWLGGNNGVKWMQCCPYALPALMSTFISLIVAYFAAQHLKETLNVNAQSSSLSGLSASTKRPWPRWPNLRHIGRRVSDVDQLHGLLDGHDYDSNEIDPLHVEKLAASTIPSKPSFWTLRLVLALISVAILDFHLGGFNNFWLLLLSSPLSQTTFPSSLLVFTGGLNFSPTSIGFTLSLVGVVGLLIQLIFYPRLHARFGLVRCFRYALVLFPIAYVAAPYVVLIPSTILRTASSSPDAAADAPASGPAVWLGILAILVLQVTARACTLPATTLLLRDAAPDPSVLATVFGVAQSVTALFKSIGPVASGYLFASGLRIGAVGLAAWSLAAVAVVGCLVGSMLQSPGEKCADDEEA